MSYPHSFLFILFFSFWGIACAQEFNNSLKIRKPVDTVGFAVKAWQMDSVMERIRRIENLQLIKAMKVAAVDDKTVWKVVVCPHDDYTYAGWLYPAALKNVKASTIIIFGVAHKAKKFNIADKIVFDSFKAWQEPYGPVKISNLRDEIIRSLPPDSYIIHDSLQQSEHSVEAIVPFLQYFDRKIQVISILVPYMSYAKMSEISGYLASAILEVINKKELEFGKDIAFVISTDAVHYGDQDWGGQNYADYGCDTSGYLKATEHETEIIDHCLTGELNDAKIRDFCHYTVKDEDFKSYKWTWCGRYSVPFGLMTAMKVYPPDSGMPLTGNFLGYSTSLMMPGIPVSDLEMGATAVANLHHWVGYVAIGYK